MTFDLLVLGASLGGLAALGTVLGGLPADFPVPVAVVQHRQPESTDLLCRLLQKRSPLPVEEAEDKQKIVPGRVYLAPAGYHLLAERGKLSLSTGRPVCRVRPSIDVLFESAADAYGRALIAVVLTGANQDGARGIAAAERGGGQVLIQNPQTAEAPAMPKAAIAAARKPAVRPLGEIAPAIMRLVVPGPKGD